MRPDLLEELLQSSTLPLQAWVNIRRFNLPEDWILMDTVGMAQFDLPDLEDCFASNTQEPGEVAPRLLSFAEHMVQRGDVFGPGDTVDGTAGVLWRAKRPLDSLVDPARQVVRFLPTSGGPSFWANPGRPTNWFVGYWSPWYSLAMKHVVQLGERGRLVLPAAVRRELGLKAGDRLLLEVGPDGLKLSSTREKVESARGIFRHLEPSGVWSQELIEERRRQSEIE